MNDLSLQELATWLAAMRFNGAPIKYEFNTVVPIRTHGVRLQIGTFVTDVIIPYSSTLHELLLVLEHEAQKVYSEYLISFAHDGISLSIKRAPSLSIASTAEFVGRCHSVLLQTRYRNWTFLLEPIGDGALLQVQFDAPCAETGQVEIQRGRKFYLSQHMTDSEIVQSAFLACKVAEEHELRELFSYQNQPIFHPHYKLETLAHFCENVPRDYRENVPQSEVPMRS